jgi:hypothetical protein
MRRGKFGMADQRLRQFHATFFPAFVREGTLRKKIVDRK